MSDINTELQANGWARVEKVFDDRELDAIADCIQRHTATRASGPATPTLTDTAPDGRPLPRKLGEPFFVDSAFRRLAFDPRIMALIAPLLAPEPELLFDHVFMKPARHGSEKHWHQDGFYYDIPERDKGISVWVALHDADEENGCLCYYNASDRGGLQPHEYPGNEPSHVRLASIPGDFGEPVAAPARRGDVLLHNFYTVHGSGPNRSDRDRWAYSSHWVARGVRGAGVSWAKTYPLRDSYQALVTREALRPIPVPSSPRG